MVYTVLMHRGFGKVRVYYDGACGVCASLAERLRTSEHADAFVCNDITSCALPSEIPAHRARRDVYVADRRGRIFRGVDAIFLVMDEYPLWRVVAFAGRLPGVHLIAAFIYRIVMGGAVSFAHN